MDSFSHDDSNTELSSMSHGFACPRHCICEESVLNVTLCKHILNGCVVFEGCTPGNTERY